MKPFHYVNVDAKAQSFRRERDCPNGCVVTALTQFVALLESRDPALSLSERRRAIYWIAHFLGDIHQPLHIAHPDGKGGIATLLRFFEAPDKRNAHWIWDFGLIERRPPAAAAASDAVASDQPAFRALADELAAQLTPGKVRAFGRTLSPEALANEGLALSRRYAFLHSADIVDAAYESSRWPIVASNCRKPACAWPPCSTTRSILIRRAQGDTSNVWTGGAALRADRRRLPPLKRRQPLAEESAQRRQQARCLLVALGAQLGNRTTERASSPV